MDSEPFGKMRIPEQDDGATNQLEPPAWCHRKQRSGGVNNKGRISFLELLEAHMLNGKNPGAEPSAAEQDLSI